MEATDAPLKILDSTIAISSLSGKLCGIVLVATLE